MNRVLEHLRRGELNKAYSRTEEFIEFWANEPILYSFALIVEERLMELRQELISLIPKLNEKELEVLTQIDDEEISEKASTRLDELRGIMTITLDKGELKKILKILFMEGVISEKDINDVISGKVKKLRKQWNGNKIEVNVGRRVKIKGPKNLLAKFS